MDAPADVALRPFTTGFFDPASRAAGETTPDDEVVMCADAAADAEFVNGLHPHLGFGRFELWPTLQNLLGQREHSDSWLELCERGALLFLRTVLLESVGIPRFDEWCGPLTTPRVCERFGDAYAPFVHTDLRVGGFKMYNIWVPVRDIDSEPLLLCAAAPGADDERWRKPSETACHLPPSCAHEAAWYYFGGTRRGHAILFPGDGGEAGIFHASAWVSHSERHSFDCREFVSPYNGDEAEKDAAAKRLVLELAAWEREVEALG